MNLKVLAVTSWGGACGIANFCQMLQEAIQPLGVEILPDASALDPRAYVDWRDALNGTPYDLLWLNYHAGLHSRWTPTEILLFKEVAPNVPVVVTYHDTYDGTRSPNSENAKQIAKIVDRFIVHEPVSDIPEAVVIRQGIPKPPPDNHWEVPASDLVYGAQPILGTAGFDFPWKNYTRLAELTAEIGWAFLLLSNDITPVRARELYAINPAMRLRNGFKPTAEIVARLSSCTATAWMYECANSGTSGAIRLGIAAMKPLYALRSCRQFRDLVDLEETRGIWVDTWADLKYRLVHEPIRSGFAPSAALYATDSWERQAQKYSEIFQSLAGRSR